MSIPKPPRRGGFRVFDLPMSNSNGVQIETTTPSERPLEARRGCDARFRRDHRTDPDATSAGVSNRSDDRPAAPGIAGTARASTPAA
jgi:hypothetical protein